MKHVEGTASSVRDPRRWAELQFGNCKLGDIRRTQRLVDYAARQAVRPEASTHAVCSGNDAVAEGTYRWVRNSAIDRRDVDEGPFQATTQICKSRQLLLAIQDTTTLTHTYCVADELGSVGAVEGHHVAGVLVHSTLMVDAQNRYGLWRNRPQSFLSRLWIPPSGSACSQGRIPMAPSPNVRQLCNGC
jgi:hypothetical protein